MAGPLVEERVLVRRMAKRVLVAVWRAPGVRERKEEGGREDTCLLHPFFRFIGSVPTVVDAPVQQDLRGPPGLGLRRRHGWGGKGGCGGGYADAGVGQRPLSSGKRVQVEEEEEDEEEENEEEKEKRRRKGAAEQLKNRRESFVFVRLLGKRWTTVFLCVPFGRIPLKLFRTFSEALQ